MSKKDDFFEFVEKKRKEKSTELIYNASIDHATVLMQQLFQVAIDEKKDVKIISGDLKNEFYEKLIVDIDKVFDAGCKVSLIILNSNNNNLDNNAFANACKNNKNGMLKQQTNDQIVCPHFMLVGNEAFRLETDHEQSKATACFMNQEIGSILDKSFDEVLKTIH